MKEFFVSNCGKIKELLYKHGVMFASLLLGYFVFLGYICNNHVFNSAGLSIIIAILVALLLMIISACAIYFENELHKFFLIVFSFFGLIYFFVYPMSSVPDEHGHFYRAYEISEGYFVSDIVDGWGGRTLPKGLSLGLDGPDVSLEESWDTFDIKITDEREYYIFWNISLYAPVSYIPQSLGIFVARIFTDSIAIMYMMGRLFNLLAVGVIAYFAVKYIPIGKKLVIMIMLIPINMQEAISLAPDAMVTALTMAFMAYVLHLRYTQKTVMSKRQLALLYVMAIAISLYKIVYIPFCMLPFLIPKERFGGKKQFIIHAVCMGTLVVAAGLGWLSFAGRYLMDIEGGKNSDDQVMYILGDLPNYFKILFSTMKAYGKAYFYTMFGQSLSWLNVFVPKGYVILYALLIFAGVFSEEEIPEKFKPVRIVSAIIVVSIFLLTMTSLYVQWTDYKAELISGVQGRYFIPLLLPLILLMSFGLKPSLNRFFKLKNYILPLVTVNIIVVLILLGKFVEGPKKWIKDDNGWRSYRVFENAYETDMWDEINDVWYYFDENGYALSEEWLETDTGNYYFSDSCALVTGWELIDGEWYYFDSGGRAFSGWIESDSDWYYCEDGKMWYDCMTPDGYLLDEDGKWIQE